MNTRTFLLQILAPFVGGLLGTLMVASPLLMQEPRAPRSSRHALMEHRASQRAYGSRVAHSNLPSVVEQLDQIHDNYAQDVQDQAVEYRMAMTGANYAQDVQDQAVEYRMAMTGASKKVEVDPYPYAPPKPSVDFTEAQEAAIEAGQDPWGR